ncbi:hypothetical protein F4810DRAFT_690705 [Camillea tinctor]|nr:hypothetical protein F4810DRAFT_690705 [Camillea tinctor]
MDDQFNGRTDDDLFADDFEPVYQEEQVVEVPPVPESIVAATQSTPPPQASAQPQAQPVTSSALEAPQPIPTPAAAPATSATPPLSAPKSLSQSRHAKGAHQSRPRKHSPKQAPPPAASLESPQPLTSTTAESNDGAATTPTPSSTANTATSAASATTSSPIRPGSNTALADRLASGANPRTKLTDSELAAKMERMRILAAEKTRKFEQAEQDSRSHALAYERGMEEARRRRAEEAERRRKGEEERRRMDEERAANRERKLKAMGAKQDAWDEGKNMDEEPRRFRGANGGVRGSRHAGGAGIAGSRFAPPDPDDVPVREFSADEFRGRGRGRGRGSSRGGRGGRGGGGSGSFYDGDRGSARERGPQATAQNGTSKPKETQVVPSAEDFPALPSSSNLEKLDTSRKPNDVAKPAPLPISLPSPLTGRWDDEMEALDASMKNGA